MRLSQMPTSGLVVVARPVMCPQAHGAAAMRGCDYFLTDRVGSGVYVFNLDIPEDQELCAEFGGDE